MHPVSPRSIDAIHASIPYPCSSQCFRLVFVTEIQTKVWLRFCASDSNRDFCTGSILAEERIDGLQEN